MTKICDFGFSVIRSASKGLSAKSKTDEVRWKALECLESESRPPPESDVYWLALCVIEAVSGELPWGQMEDDAILDKLCEGKGHKRPDGLTDNQWEVIQGMAEIDMAQRTPLAKAVKLLGEFASEEEERCRLAAVVHECPECRVTSTGPVRFCSNCGHRTDAP